MILILTSLVLLGGGVGFLCSCRDKENGYKVQMASVVVGVLCLVVSSLGFGVFLGGTLRGYPVGKESLTTNAVYEIVSSDVVDKKIISILKEPDGALRFFILESGDIRTVEGGKWLKAVKDGGIVKLVPLNEL